MLKGLPVLCTILLLVSPAAATTLVDSLQTHISDNIRNQTNELVMHIYSNHTKLMLVLRQT